MAERAAHLVDDVFPIVQVRQWVLSLPHRLRYVLAWDHALCRAVSGVFVRAVLGLLRRRARQAGVPGGRGGAVAIVQRFGAALNLNVHIHALVLDGVYVEVEHAGLRFHEAVAPTDDDMDRLLRTIDRRIHRLLARRGVLDDRAEGRVDPWREEAPVLAGIAEASVQDARRLASGPARRCGGVARQRNCWHWRRRGTAPVTHEGTASAGPPARLRAGVQVSTPPLSCRRRIGPGSNGSVAMRSGRPSPPTACI
jgi:hypothetical protein